MSYGLDGRRIRFRLLGATKYLSLLYSVETGPGNQVAPYAVGTHLHLILRLRMTAAVCSLPRTLCAVVRNFTFTLTAESTRVGNAG